MIERFSEGPSDSFELMQLPPLRRSWFISNDGRHLLQVQEDRFLFNWKRASDTDAYPSYKRVIEGFTAKLDLFLEFLAEQDLGDVTFRQYEMTYVNHLGLAGEFDMRKPAAILIDHRRAETADRFLPEPEAVSWTDSYLLPDGAGRLHVVAKTARTPDRRLVVRLDLTARGLPHDLGREGRAAWFRLAHDWITHGFADVTSPNVQTAIWRRRS